MRPLAERGLTYDAVGATRPGQWIWADHPAGFRAHERTVLLGHGQACWDDASADVLAWAVKTRSGFTVEPPGVATGADRCWLVARVGPFSVREPIKVIAVVDRPDRRGLAYGTLDGHPISGEEAFIVRRDASGAVWLDLRSLTAPGRGWWRPAFPLVLVAQRFYRRRYARALRA
ncbi:DUF1990 family protein [Cellulomonas sp. McL0617]|uniref:DUF1990 family protein n=1 Tax=Cellulomonas sp. McL0617 TaxID=3415675 RepID=UPI003CECB16D